MVGNLHTGTASETQSTSIIHWQNSFGRCVKLQLIFLFLVAFESRLACSGKVLVVIGLKPVFATKNNKKYNYTICIKFYKTTEWWLILGEGDVCMWSMYSDWMPPPHPTGVQRLIHSCTNGMRSMGCRTVCITVLYREVALRSQIFAYLECPSHLQWHRHRAVFISNLKEKLGTYSSHSCLIWITFHITLGFRSI